MRGPAILLVMIGLFGLCNSSRAADDYKDLIVGTWEITYSDSKDVPVGTKLEFTKSGKMNLTVKNPDGKEVTAMPVGYKVEKDYIVITGKDGNKNDKGHICLLNKSSFVINDEIEDKVMVLKPVKTK